MIKHRETQKGPYKALKHALSPSHTSTLLHKHYGVALQCKLLDDFGATMKAKTKQPQNHFEEQLQSSDLQVTKDHKTTCRITVNATHIISQCGSPITAITYRFQKPLPRPICKKNTSECTHYFSIWAPFCFRRKSLF